MMLQNNKTMVWNCRGAASPGFYLNCKQYLNIHRPDILVIMETRDHPNRLRNTFMLERCSLLEHNSECFLYLIVACVKTIEELFFQCFGESAVNGMIL